MKLRSRAAVGLAVLVGGGVALFVLIGTGWLAGARTQGGGSGRVPTIEEYQPNSTLVTPEHRIERAKYPFVDIHSHHWNPTVEHVDQVLKEMDTINLRVMVNLSGGTGEQLRQAVATMKGRYRFWMDC